MTELDVYQAAIRAAIERGVRIGIEVAVDCLRGAADAHRLLGRAEVGEEFDVAAAELGPAVEAILLTPKTPPADPAPAVPQHPTGATRG